MQTVAILMKLSALLSAMVGARRHPCWPSDHVVTVVRARRLGDGLRRRYRIRCRRCGLELGSSTEWQAAWLDAWRAQHATRGRGEDRERSPRPASSRAGT